jgi:hypothetical protein
LYAKNLENAGIHENHIAKGQFQPGPIREGTQKVTEMASEG